MDNGLSAIESMLFGLKEVTVDTDAMEVKQIIDQNITQLKEASHTVDTQQTVAFVKETTHAVSAAFKKRQQQMLTDSEIVKRINIKIDAFRDEHKVKIEGLLAELMRDIDQAIDEYSNELIRRLDPYTIKERFKKKEDFELWLNILNTSYKTSMEKTVDRRTQNTIRSYLVDVEDVFETASSYLSEREQFMDAEDKFYGTLASSKNLITRDIKNNINELTTYNKSLYEASEDLFNGIWAARKEYDLKRNATSSAITSGGVALGAVAVKAVVGKAVAAKAAAMVAGKVGFGAAATAGALPLIVGIGALVVGGVIIHKTATKLSASLYSGKLESDVRACVEEFKSEIYKSKTAMQSHITESVNLIFENELKSLDRTFLELRKTTYIDEDKIPLLAAKIEALENEVHMA